MTMYRYTLMSFVGDIALTGTVTATFLTVYYTSQIKLKRMENKLDAILESSQVQPPKEVVTLPLVEVEPRAKWDENILDKYMASKGCVEVHEGNYSHWKTKIDPDYCDALKKIYYS